MLVLSTLYSSAATQAHNAGVQCWDGCGGSAVAAKMSHLAEPLLPSTGQARAETSKVSLGRFVMVGLITLTIFLLFIIILASQLPPQQTMGITTVGSREQDTGRTSMRGEGRPCVYSMYVHSADKQG